jgi:hypothetical protein
MARSVSAAFKRAVFAQETDEVFVFLLTIEHAELEEPMRVCSNSVQVVSRGEAYLPLPFGAMFPGEHDDELARVRLTIDNVDRRIVEAVRTITSAPTVTLEAVLASAPDNVEAGPYDFRLRDVRYDQLVVEGELSFEDLLNEAYPEGIFAPSDFPGIF